MAVKLIVYFFVLLILYCLGSGAFYLVRPSAAPASLARALTWRVALSLTLFLLLLASYFFGWLAPSMIVVVPSS